MACYPFRIRYARFTFAYLLSLVYSAYADLPSSRSSLDARSLERVESSAPAFTDASARERIVFLRSEIARHDDLYFKQASPEISDFEYDRLKQESQRLERSYPEIAVSLGAPPGIGDDRHGSFQTVRHGTPMLSLRKAYSNSALQRFHDQASEAIGTEAITYLIEPKIDGIAISLTYEHGRLIRVLTRGNGTEGHDITANILTISSVPRKLANVNAAGNPIPIPDRIEVRGELFSTFTDFKAINEQREALGEPRFTHPRNLAAGSVKLSDPNQAARRKLSVLIFGYGQIAPLSIAPKTQHAFYEQARAWGLPVLNAIRTAEGFGALTSAIATQNARRSQLAFPTDGLVVKVNSLALQRLLGNSDRAPRWALAYKFAPEQVETRLRAIRIQVGRTGLLTPVAELDPVSLTGSIISRATLHNRNVIAQKDLRIGDTVLIEKAGEIIPSIVGINLSKRPPGSIPYEFPDHCPSCFSKIDLDTLVANVRCSNVNCPAQLQRRIEHFASSQCVGIKGLGPATIEALVANGLVTGLPDIYKLNASKLLSLGKHNYISTNKLLQSIERSKRVELWRFIFGLGIPGIGKSRAQTLAESFGSLDALSKIDATEIESAGSSRTRQSIAKYFTNSENRAQIAELIQLGIHPSTDIARTEIGLKPLRGNTFALTGKLSNFTRQQVIQLIESRGGTVRDQVSSKIDYLLAGSNPGAKVEKAQAYNITIIDEASFLILSGKGESKSNVKALNP